MSSLTLFRSYSRSTRSLHSRIASGQYTDARNFRAALVKEEKDDKPEDLKPNSVPVHVAYQLLQDGHPYLDVRTNAEFRCGHPKGAINIPYMFINGQDMSKNTNFLKQVESRFKQDEGILTIFSWLDYLVPQGLRSGKRSLMAAFDLQFSISEIQSSTLSFVLAFSISISRTPQGFTGVTDFAGGYQAWTENGLPTAKQM